MIRIDNAQVDIGFRGPGGDVFCPVRGADNQGIEITIAQHLMAQLGNSGCQNLRVAMHPARNQPQAFSRRDKPHKIRR